MPVSGHGRLLLLATAGGKEAEQQEGDTAEDQDIHELETFEAITHEHRGEQSTGCEAGQWAEPARGTAGGCWRLAACLSRGGLGLLGRLASLMAGRRAKALAAAETLGVGIEAEGQADTQRHENAEHTLHLVVLVG